MAHSALLIDPKLSSAKPHAASTFRSSLNQHFNTMPEPVVIDGDHTVHGLSVTPLTQCAHWHSQLDIIAIKHFCCKKFYACISCHDACETHASEVWPRMKRDEGAVLCGQCRHVLTVDEYLKSGSKCTKCESGFNPGCKNHWGLYFELDGE